MADGTARTSPPSQLPDPDSPFARVLARVLAHRWRTSPVAATADGCYERADELDSFDARTLAAQLDETDGLVADLRALDGDALSPDEALDRDAVLGTLTADLHDWRVLRTWTWNPAICADTALYGCHLLAIRDTRPVAERMGWLAGRLHQVPRTLAEGLAAIREPSAILTETAIESCDGARELFRTTLPAAAEAAPPLLRDAVARGCAAASAAFEAHARELAAILARGEATRSPAIGEEAFTDRFEQAHGLAISTDALLRLSAEVRASTEERLAAVAARIDPTRTWREVVAGLRSDHPAPEDLLAAYRGDVERMRTAIAARRLATATDDPLAVIETPLFERPLYPVAAYLQPAPLDRGGGGYFYVTPVDERADPSDRAAALAQHGRATIALLTVHEAYPGHHLQMTRAKRSGSIARLIYGTPLLWEGWALYCEQMMVEEVLGDDLRVELTQLRDALFRAWRIDIDVRLHRGEWTPQECERRLVRELDMAPATARAEVRRYAAWPTQASTYLVGRELLLDLRQRLREREGSAFDLGRFHDRVLGFGNLSPARIREVLLGEPAAGAATETGRG